MNQHSKVSRCELLLEQYPVDVQNCEKSLPPLLIEGLILAVANKCKIFEVSPQYLHRCIIYYHFPHDRSIHASQFHVTLDL